MKTARQKSKLDPFSPTFYFRGTFIYTFGVKEGGYIQLAQDRKEGHLYTPLVKEDGYIQLVQDKKEGHLYTP